MKKIILGIIAFVLFGAVILTINNNPNSQVIEKTEASNMNEVEILSHTKGVNYEYPYIVGEVINNSNEPLSYIRVEATYYDEKGNVIGTDFNYAGDSMTKLQPNDKAPFKIISTQKIKYSDYKLSITHQ